MNTTHPWHSGLKGPKLSLIYYFVAWKLLLILVALGSPGPGYDTSTSLALEHHSTYQASSLEHSDRSRFFRLSNIFGKLTRWDAIYFTQIAHGGYTLEQQWMAGWGFTKLLSLFTDFETSLEPSLLAAVAGVVVAHVSHLISVLVLHELSLLSLQSLHPMKRSSIASLAASLHIISPAGMFLSAPYGESLFSLMNFMGLYLYARSLLRFVGEPSRDAFLVASGLCLGLASIVRGNGLLSGLIFVYEAVAHAFAFLVWKDNMNKPNIRRVCVLLLTGTLMGAVAIFPQGLAYLEYCTPAAQRPWCSRTVPSIYAWVQSEYWEVGFFRYWTLSNLPLFLLAMPMLYIMYASSIWAWSYTAPPRPQHQANAEDKTPRALVKIDNFFKANGSMQDEIVRRFAVPQMVLAVMALTSYHVQIITRLSSGYPVCYWWLAYVITEDSREIIIMGRSVKLGALITRWMIMYAIIQGGLFASFLPPA